MSAPPPPPPENHHDLDNDAAARGQPAAAAAAAAQLARAKVALRPSLRHFQDFPVEGIDFVDIMPLFADPAAHASLLDALYFQTLDPSVFPAGAPDVVVGLDARGFLFGPALALRLGVPFAAVRKKGKLPGPCVTAEYVKEYGKDLFQMQQDAVKQGQKVLIVDDIIATGQSDRTPPFPLFSVPPLLFFFALRQGKGSAKGAVANGDGCWFLAGGSAKAASDLVTQLHGVVSGFLFILEIPGLNGCAKLPPVPTAVLLEDA